MKGWDYISFKVSSVAMTLFMNNEDIHYISQKINVKCFEVSFQNTAGKAKYLLVCPNYILEF